MNSTPPDPGHQEITPDQGRRLLAAASTQLGQPYKWAGESRAEGGFDCSGLVQWAASRVGIVLPRVAADQQRQCLSVRAPQLRPGDLVFFGVPAHHVGIHAGVGALGRPTMVVAPHTGGVVEVEVCDAPGAPLYARIQVETHPLGYPLRRLLMQGLRGNDVAALQQGLHVTPDGDFGPRTRGAVLDVQHAHGLTEDGIVGPLTAPYAGMVWQG